MARSIKRSWIFPRKKGFAKNKIIESYKRDIPKLHLVVDLGGNNGHYSRIFADDGFNTVCADIDPFAVEDNYRKVKNNRETMLLPLLVDLTNPAGSLGWGNQEREPVHDGRSIQPKGAGLCDSCKTWCDHARISGHMEQI